MLSRLHRRYLAVATCVVALPFATIAATDHADEGADAPSIRHPPGGRPSSRPTLEAMLAHANNVYLTEIHHEDGYIHHRVVAVWRHDPKAGEPIAVGADSPDLVQRPFIATMGYPDQVVYFQFDPAVLGPDGKKNAAVSLGIFKGRAKTDNLSLAELEKRVKSTAFTPQPAVSH